MVALAMSSLHTAVRMLFSRWLYGPWLQPMSCVGRQVQQDDVELLGHGADGLRGVRAVAVDDQHKFSFVLDLGAEVFQPGHKNVGRHVAALRIGDGEVAGMAATLGQHSNAARAFGPRRGINQQRVQHVTAHFAAS
jgi:hypothetical protein